MVGMTPEEEAAFIADAGIEASKMDVDAAVNTELVQKLLAQPDLAECGVYRFGDMEIRYKPFLTSRLRSLLKRADKESKVDGADKLAIQDRVVYDGLAEVCMDPQLKHAAVWATIDARSNDGRVYKIFRDIMEKVGGGDTSIKSFR